MQDQTERELHENFVPRRVKQHAPEIVGAASLVAAGAVIAYYRHKYGGEVLFTVNPDVMNALHREGTAVLQELGNGRYTLTTLPI